MGSRLVAALAALCAAGCEFHADLGAVAAPHPTATAPAAPPSQPNPPAALFAAPAPPPPSRVVAAPQASHSAPPQPPSNIVPGPLAGAPGSYLGCFVDAADRDLRDSWSEDSGMSVQVCAEHCRARNAQYFGLQNGSYCACGNSYGRYGQLTEKDCNVPCSGNRSQMCGSPWRSSVYKTGAGPAAPPGRAAGAPAGTYLGCFVDAADRDLRDSWNEDSGMSMQVCAEHCRSRNAQYFGLQNGSYCACGNSYGRYGQLTEKDCNVPCSGNRSQMCGSPWRSSVYKTVP